MGSMGPNQRRSPRVRCRIPCRVRLGREETEAIVRDVSIGGLSAHGALSGTVGENVEVEMQLGGGPPLQVSGIVWHSHRVRSRDGRTGTLLGVVVSNPPEAFLALSDRRKERPSPIPTSEPSSSDFEEEAPPIPDPGRRFQVRVKQDASPRSRVIGVEADSPEEAERLALAEAGDGWTAIAVDAV